MAGRANYLRDENELENVDESEDHWIRATHGHWIMSAFASIFAIFGVF